MPKLSKSKTIPVMSPRILGILTDWANSRSCASYLKQRSLIQIYAAQGKSNKEIAELVELHHSHVGKWRTRFIEGLDRLKTIETEYPDRLRKEICLLLSDNQRSGAPPTYSQIQRDEIIKIACNYPRDFGYEGSQWFYRLLTEAVRVSVKGCEKISVSTVRDILVKNKLRPFKSHYWMHSKELDEDPEEYFRKLKEAHGIYLLADKIRKTGSSNVHIFSTDEMTGIQALEREYQRLASPGHSASCEFNYIRHGTTTLIGFFNVVNGTVATPFLNKTRNEEDFVAAIKQLMDEEPNEKSDLWIFICDNLNIHCSASLVEFVAKECGIETPLGKKGQSGVLKDVKSRVKFLNDSSHQIYFVYTPKHCSWMNQIEWFFGVIGRHLLKKGNYTSVDELEASIRRYVKQHNELFAHPYGWNVDIDKLIKKVSKHIIHKQSSDGESEEAS